MKAKHVLEYEPNNPYFLNAVAKRIDKVAYLARPSAQCVSQISNKNFHQGPVLCKPYS